jgi:hypothetical protein
MSNFTSEELEKTYSLQNQHIIIETGAKYGLTKTEALIMYAQYWHEYIIKKFTTFENDQIIVKGVGTFKARIKQVSARIKQLTLERNLGEEYENLIKLYEYCYEILNGGSSKKQFKRATEKIKRNTKDRILFYICTPG